MAEEQGRRRRKLPRRNLSLPSSLPPPTRHARVLDSNERTVSPRLDDDVLEFADFAQPSGGADAQLVELVGGGGFRADAARGHLHVLLAQRAGDVTSAEAAAGQTVRVEPKAHGEPALAEDDHVAHARYPLQRVPHVPIDVVADEE